VQNDLLGTLAGSSAPRSTSLARRIAALSTAVTLACMAGHADAADVIRSASGTFGQTQWQAQSMIVGTQSTATSAGGGNPAYFAPMPKYSGVVTLIMDYGAAGSFICSGTLLPDRRSILTAAHCVTDAALANPIKTTAYFYAGSNPDTIPAISPDATAIDIGMYFVNSAYTGEVIDQNDVAVLRLASDAPAFAASYDLYTDELTGADYNIAGYGARSNGGGNVGANLGAGRLRQGDNSYDFRMGDADFTGGWELIFGLPTEQIGYSYLADFDNGLAANDASCNVAGDPFFGLSGPKYCDLGRGLMEVSSAPGDSGGPQFIDGKIASVTSYGLTFGSFYGDIDDKLNDTFGEFNGFVPVFVHADFIRYAMSVPEPGSLALLGLGLIGIGLSGRRKRS